ncbi:(2Fe-2S)-binding protein [Candidimonas nitroreducens]|uniref:(2Fe-2S)-binding protein n=2 Tax=Candidimonas nitroreducens TaxID=683354 RepID=A0A225MDR3_9BURK|nr:(2Fe-2S)-binding protein [Candidimonas nitroreducens]
MSTSVTSAAAAASTTASAAASTTASATAPATATATQGAAPAVAAAPSRAVSMTINGQAVGPFQVPETLMLIDYLHEYAGLTGSRLGCGQGICHACVVILDQPDGTSVEMRSCITGAAYFQGKKIRTIEGHAQRNAAGEVTALSPVQQKFLEFYSFQCGYCTPGFVNAATVLLERLARQPIAKDQVESVVTQALDSHICRCTGYVRYHRAVRDLVLSTPGLTKDGGQDKLKQDVAVESKESGHGK